MIILGNPRVVVIDMNESTSRLFCQGDVELSTPFKCLRGVQQDIGHDLAQLVGVIGICF